MYSTFLCASRRVSVPCDLLRLLAVFRWDKNTAAPPHDVWLASSKASYDACSTAGGTKLSEVTNTGQVKYKVKAAAGKKLYFICSYTFHCLVGMKTAIKIS